MTMQKTVKLSAALAALTALGGSALAQTPPPPPPPTMGFFTTCSTPSPASQCPVI